jgi:hypothetical protein
MRTRRSPSAASLAFENDLFMNEFLSACESYYDCDRKFNAAQAEGLRVLQVSILLLRQGFTAIIMVNFAALCVRAI